MHGTTLDYVLSTYEVSKPPNALPFAAAVFSKLKLQADRHQHTDKNGPVFSRRMSFTYSLDYWRSTDRPTNQTDQMEHGIKQKTLLNS